MYKKKSVIYADAGKVLQKDTTVGLYLEDVNEDEITETDIDFSEISIKQSFGITIAVFNNSYVSFAFENCNTLDDLKKSIMESRYPVEDQISILSNKEKTTNGQVEYDRLVDWYFFSTKAAKAIAEKMDIKTDDSIDTVKEEKINKIIYYDNSDNVNSFTYNGLKTWIDKPTRVALMNSTSILQKNGIKTTTLWLGEKNIDVKCEDLISVLNDIEMYALKCYNITAQHKATVQMMDDIETIENYDYKVGYPKPLEFNF